MLVLYFMVGINFVKQIIQQYCNVEQDVSTCYDLNEITGTARSPIVQWNMLC